MDHQKKRQIIDLPFFLFARAGKGDEKTGLPIAPIGNADYLPAITRHVVHYPLGVSFFRLDYFIFFHSFLLLPFKVCKPIGFQGFVFFTEGGGNILRSLGTKNGIHAAGIDQIGDKRGGLGVR